MGFIRGGLIVIISILLFIIFLAGGVFLTVTLSLQYENVYDRLSPIIQDTLGEEIGVDIASEIEKEIGSMEIQCEDYPEGYVFSEQGYTITLSCDTLTQGTAAIVSSGVDSLIEAAYYKEYTCDFWKCFEEEEIPLFLISEYAKNYWRAKFYLALGIAIVLMVALFFLFRKKQNIFIVPGILLIVAALPFLRIGALVSISGDRMILELLSIFFSKAKSVFRISFFIGIGFIAVGFVFKLFLVGFKLSRLFHREESKEVKAPIKEVKEVKSVQKTKKK